MVVMFGASNLVLALPSPSSPKYDFAPFTHSAMRSQLADFPNRVRICPHLTLAIAHHSRYRESSATLIVL